MSQEDTVFVRMGEFALAQGRGTLAALGLGSCVAVILHDPTVQVGALAHVLLPVQSLSRLHSSPTRTADMAIPLVVAQMTQRGAKLESTVANLIGGGTMFGDLLPAGSVHIGERNAQACRDTLREVGIPVVAEAVGGRSSRSVWFEVGSGTVTVRVVGEEPVVL
ncbi:MAG: chemotaxis protein CheD [Gemmatimonadales bacterium]|nr:chemotaxis protein CheD [Gemmatimonadales bacterium]NIN49994.1 chemotaxis protein CheD [Gemmatimonadales bacterium]NIP07458.1 chemotaxis protein CheD [Gemmatimonadales bacterium]NIR03097.1 chemotaxis protein CheD [Gemmatimonadales bacterium]NIS66809.1 chemotaxis protein CheD [Gemmatimonadales bacterium]